MSTKQQAADPGAATAASTECVAVPTTIGRVVLLEYQGPESARTHFNSVAESLRAPALERALGVLSGSTDSVRVAVVLNSSAKETSLTTSSDGTVTITAGLTNPDTLPSRVARLIAREAFIPLAVTAATSAVRKGSVQPEDREVLTELVRCFAADLGVPVPRDAVRVAIAQLLAPPETNAAAQQGKSLHKGKRPAVKERPNPLRVKLDAELKNLVSEWEKKDIKALMNQLHESESGPGVKLHDVVEEGMAACAKIKTLDALLNLPQKHLKVTEGIITALRALLKSQFNKALLTEDREGQRVAHECLRAVYADLSSGGYGRPIPVFFREVITNDNIRGISGINVLKSSLSSGAAPQAASSSAMFDAPAVRNDIALLNALVQRDSRLREEARDQGQGLLERIEYVMEHGPSLAGHIISFQRREPGATLESLRLLLNATLHMAIAEEFAGRANFLLIAGLEGVHKKSMKETLADPYTASDAYAFTIGVLSDLESYQADAERSFLETNEYFLRSFTFACGTFAVTKYQERLYQLSLEDGKLTAEDREYVISDLRKVELNQSLIAACIPQPESQQEIHKALQTALDDILELSSLLYLNGVHELDLPQELAAAHLAEPRGQSPVGVQSLKIWRSLETRSREASGKLDLAVAVIEKEVQAALEKDTPHMLAACRAILEREDVIKASSLRGKVEEMVINAIEERAAVVDTDCVTPMKDCLEIPKRTDDQDMKAHEQALSDTATFAFYYGGQAAQELLMIEKALEDFRDISGALSDKTAEETTFAQRLTDLHELIRKIRLDSVGELRRVYANQDDLLKLVIRDQHLLEDKPREYVTYGLQLLRSEELS